MGLLTSMLEIASMKSNFDNNEIEQDKIDLERGRINLELEKMRREDSRKEKEHILSTHSSVLEKIGAIASIKIPNDKDELIHLLSELSTNIKASGWQKNKEEGNIRNKFTDALFEKYKQCVLKLESVAEEDTLIEYYKSNIAKISRKRYWSKYGIHTIVGSLIFIFIIVPSIIGILVANDVFYDFEEGVMFFLVGFIVIAFGISAFYIYKILKKKNKKQNI